MSVSQIAEAEKILNRTLAYQAAIAVHELKDRLNLDVLELKLVVTPADDHVVGSYRVSCHVVDMTASSELLVVEVLVKPDIAVVPAQGALRKQG